MNLGVFAWKSLRRSPIRTAFKAISIGAITAIMLVWGCLNAGLGNLLEATATSFEIGEFQLHAPGYLSNPDIYATLDHAEAWQAALLKDGFLSAPRLYGSALGAAGSLSAGVQVRGLDLEREAHVTRIERFIGSGDWLTTTKPHGVVIGKLLARHLHLQPGQEMVLLAQAADGSLANTVFPVVGILKSVNSEIDNRAVYLQEAAFREFFLIEKGIHELAISRVDQNQPFTTAELRLRQLVAMPDLGNELKSWRQLKPLLAKILDLLAVSANFICIFIYLALGGLILNMTFMSIYDRRREFGTMQALGMGPGQMVLLILAEASWKSLLSAGVATFLGLPLAFYLAQTGLDLSLMVDHLSVSGINLEPIIYPQITVLNVIKPVAFMMLSQLLFSIFPGVEVAVMVPVEALSPH